MTVYIAREASKLWRRIMLEFSVELPLLAEKWKLLLLGLFCQYLHGLAARVVHYLHRPGPVLLDTGFRLLPELGPEKAYISEYVFLFIFISFILWSFNPFFFQSKRFYTVLLWCRVFAFLVTSQFLRILTFLATQLPGPNYHCREGSYLAQLPPPHRISEVLLLNFPRGIIYGCGDLIFSSHMIFSLVFIRVYQKYGTKRCIKQLAWLAGVIQSLLIIASRKHYSVDVVVAWYTVNLVVCFVDRKMPEEFWDRSGTQAPLLPLNSKDKDGGLKEEYQKLLNGSSIEIVDWRLRTQANAKILNGKALEDTNQGHVDRGVNGK